MNSTAYENSIVLQIDEKNRAITNDGKNTPIILGVKGDDCAERVYFESPKILSPEINLLDETEGVSVRVFVNYKNASNEPYIQECTDVAAVANTDTATFSWLVTNNATNTKGDVKFNVCVKKFDSDGKLTNEWHTTTFVGKILDGIDVTAKTPEVITHDTVTLQALTLEVQNYAASVNSLTAKYEDVEAAIDASVDSKMDSYTTTEDADSKYLSKTDASSTYATHAMLGNVVPKVTTVLENLKHTIQIWEPTDGPSMASIVLPSAPVVGSKLKIYIGTNFTSNVDTNADPYGRYRTFVIDMYVVDNGLGIAGSATKHILVPGNVSGGIVYDGDLMITFHPNAEEANQLFVMLKTNSYDQQTYEYYGGLMTFVLDKVEMITGAGI